MVTHLYGKFSNKQISINVSIMHNEIHKLLTYKDPDISDKKFRSDTEFMNFFRNLLYRFGGLNTLLGKPHNMVLLLSTLQAAYDLLGSEDYDYYEYRRMILDSHGYLKSIIEGVTQECQV